MPDTTIPTIPTVDELAADVVTHHYDDMMAPSGLTNFLGTVRIEHDLTAVGAATFPPISQGLTRTGVLIVDGRLFESLGVAVSHAWRPDRVRRTADIDGLRIETTTVCVPGEQAVAIDVQVTNTGEHDRKVSLGLAVNAQVRRSQESWLTGESPKERNSVSSEPQSDRLVFHSADSQAWDIQGLALGNARQSATVQLSGVTPAVDDAYAIGIGGTGRGGELHAELPLPAGATDRLGYVHAIGVTRETCVATFNRVADSVPAAIRAAEDMWNEQLRAIFTPDNTEYSGHLPILETTSHALRKLYWWGVLGVIWFRREFPGNVLDRTYDTLMPDHWATTTFIWDYSLSSTVHALLDPTPMKRQLSHWIASDIHTHFGTSSLTGGPVGRWYSVNDYAMTRLVHDYVRFTGDHSLLHEKLSVSHDRAPSTVAEHMTEWAEAWKGLRGRGPLADYGEIDNLLECVSSYTHEVAGLNAANVWCMRAAAEIQEHLGNGKEAAHLRSEAERLLPEVTDLYLDGTGYFAAGQPDGSRVPVRHCYDFNMVGTTIPDDLDPIVREEMVGFFRHDLQTPSWMRALSPWDSDSSYSVRADHQWNGAYPAWPADAARALVALGAEDVALDWIEGLARSSNQGPCGQGHFVEEAMAPIGGGARKAPPQLPYMMDWACSASGAWVALVLEGLFGIDVGIDGGVVTANGCIGKLDPTARLRGLRVQGAEFDIHSDGRVIQL